MTHIQWTDETWNPIVGCTIISPGCTNCYAMKMAARLEAMSAANGKATPYAGTTKTSKAGPVWTGKMAQAPEKTLLAPLSWKKPRMVFVNSMSDLFHESVPDAWIDQVFAVMALCPQHTFQILTKRAARMRDYFAARRDGDPWVEAADQIADLLGTTEHPSVLEPKDIPLPNVWLGVSVEDQTRANERIPLLLDTPAAIRWISAEPLLGEIVLNSWIGYPAPQLDWVVCGGESGTGSRPMHSDWARSLRDQCAPAGVPFFFKQWGDWGHVTWTQDDFGIMTGHPTKAKDYVFWREIKWLNTSKHDGINIDATMAHVGKKAAGDLLDGVQHHNWPEVAS